jgi:DNA-binding SARP family transcriptional activator
MRFDILGPLRVTDARPVAVTGKRRRVLLLALLAHPNSTVANSELVDWLWPRRPPRSARSTLHAYVSTLRRVVEPHRQPRRPCRRLLTSPGGYLLHVEPDELDAAHFERLVSAARPALDGGDAPLAYELTTEALALWRGPALADGAHLDAARGEITRLEELRLAAVTVRTEAALAQRRYVDVVPELTQLVARYPLNERFCELLMVALSGCGRRADALAVYRRARTVLARELNVRPGRGLRHAEAAILSGDL